MHTEQIMAEPGVGSGPRVFIDGYNLALEEGTGVATYARNLSYALGAMGCTTGVLYGTRASHSAVPLLQEVGFFDPLVGTSIPARLQRLHSYVRLARSPIGEIAFRIPITGKVIATTYRDRLPHFDEIWNVQDMFQQMGLHYAVTRHRLKVQVPQRPALMHWTYPLPLYVPKARNLYTLHDLVPLRLPFTTLDTKKRYLRLHMRLRRTADHLVTVSENSRRDIINLLGVPEDRVTNTYQAVHIPDRLRNLPADQLRAEVEGSFGLTCGNYFLFFGAIEPKKNVGRLIQAYLASGVEAPLVIVGKKAWKSEQELRLLFDDHIRYLVQDGAYLRTRHKIILLDYAPFRLLVNLIRGARAVLFPSLYEGFGLPALEAMLLGTPVLTGNTASMPEVVGDAALQVDPYSIPALVEAIRALDGNAELRGQLAAAGPKRAALFSPERYAARLAELYGRLGVPVRQGG